MSTCSTHFIYPYKILTVCVCSSTLRSAKKNERTRKEEEEEDEREETERRFFVLKVCILRCIRVGLLYFALLLVQTDARSVCE